MADAQPTPAVADAAQAAAAGPLEALRDIHVPDAPGWWPPAPGWWLLLALGLGLLLAAFRYWQRWYGRRRPWRAALAALDSVQARMDDPNVAVQTLGDELSETLRRYALTRWPRTHIARLSGEHWQRFLAGTGGPACAGEAGRIVTDARYRRPDPIADAQARQALELALEAAREWVDAHRPGRIHAGAAAQRPGPGTSGPRPMQAVPRSLSRTNA